MTAKKVSVSVRALLGRVNRKMSYQGIVVRRCRSSSKWYNELGEFYGCDHHTDFIDKRWLHIDLEELGRDLGVLKPYEKLAD